MMKWFTPTRKLLSVHLLCHIMLVPMVMYGEIWMWIAGFVWWQWISATAISAGYHRYAAHGSFKAPKWYEWYFNILGIFANPGPVLTWAAAHRLHHMHSDTEDDPHSPRYKGWWKVYSSQWGQSTTLTRKSLAHLIKNPTFVWFHKHYFKVQLAIALAMIAIHPMLFLFGFCLPVILALHGYGMINFWAHRHGKPLNSALANVLTGGEGWHLNHHTDPLNWRIGKKWYQIDTGAWFIRLVKC